MLRQRIASRDPRTIAAFALIISAVVAVAILASRNLYDDEIVSLPIITGTPRAIIRFAGTSDVHPPGMYLLGHVALRIIPSFRWMNLIPTAVFYAGLAAFVTCLAPIFRHAASRAVFLLLATLHPQLLLWGTSYRWYSWWTGFALITVVIALQPRRSDPPLSVARSLVVATLLAALFYINYITLLFAVALAASIAFRYRALPSSRKLQMGLLTTAVFSALVISQLRILLGTQLAFSSSQRTGILSSFGRLLQGTLASECYLPWHPLAIVTAATLACALAAGVWIQARAHAKDAAEEAQNPLQSISVLAAVFFLLVALSGLGGRPRNGLLLVPALAAAFAYATNRFPARVKHAILVLIALWSAVGIGHMINRTGLTKSMMIDRPEQVAAFIRATAKDGCAVIVTYDAPLTFAISHPRDPRMLLLSHYAEPIGESARTLPAGCSHTNLYIAHSYMAGSPQWATTLKSELDSAARLIIGPRSTASFDFDPDAARKRALSRIPGFSSDLSSAAELPDYRYTVIAGPMDTSALPQLRSRLPGFCTANECRGPISPR
jgi:hypothetical protein